MSNEFETAVELDLTPGPRTRLLWLLAAGVVAAAGLSVTGPARMFVVLLGMAWLGSLRWLSKGAPVWLSWTADGALSVREADGERVWAELLPEQFVSPVLVVLRLRVGERSRSFPIWAAEQPAGRRCLAQRLIAGGWRTTLAPGDRAIGGPRKDP